MPTHEVKYRCGHNAGDIAFNFLLVKLASIYDWAINLKKQFYTILNSPYWPGIQISKRGLKWYKKDKAF